MIKFKNGVNQNSIPTSYAGKTIAEVLCEGFAETIGLDPNDDLNIKVNGVAAGPNQTLNDGDLVEFVKAAGEKGCNNCNDDDCKHGEDCDDHTGYEHFYDEDGYEKDDIDEDHDTETDDEFEARTNASNAAGSEETVAEGIVIQRDAFPGAAETTRVVTVQLGVNKVRIEVPANGKPLSQILDEASARIGQPTPQIEDVRVDGKTAKETTMVQANAKVETVKTNGRKG